MRQRPFGWHYDNDTDPDERFPDNTAHLAAGNVFRSGAPQAEALGRAFRCRLEKGERIPLLGFLATSHNGGISLIEASREDGITVLVNHEEERFSGIKHHAGYPALSVAEMRRTLGRWGIAPAEIPGVFYGFDTVVEETSARRMLRLNPGLVENRYYRFVSEAAVPSIDLDADAVEQTRASTFSHSPAMTSAFRRLVRDLALPAATPCIQVPHHESHAFFAYGASPFARPASGDAPTMVACIDGAGDASSVSLFLARGNSIDPVKRNHRADSLGVFYMPCGGTALNCVANMRLLDHFDRRFYRRRFGRAATLKLWVPPIPSDQGVVVGAPYAFAMTHGAKPAGALPSPFLCGIAAGVEDIERALREADFARSIMLGNVTDPRERRGVADWMAHAVSQGGVVGIFDGAAETGPRALGHRSILSNPCDPGTPAVLNGRVKLRERIRPLAPMMTIEEARRWFELAPGAAAADYDAYDYMVLTARARPEARTVIPAVIHEDGTSRIQIVREANNPLMHDYLLALKRRIGVAVSVNTSLNLGSPIVQTPAQALGIFRRSRGMDGIVMISEEGMAYLAWPGPGVQPVDSRVPDLLRTHREADRGTATNGGDEP